jgi:hypothetical protein
MTGKGPPADLVAGVNHPAHDDNTAIQCDRNPCLSFRCYFAFRGNRCRPRAGTNESCADSLRILSIMKEPIRDNKTTTNGVYAVQKIVSMVIVSTSRVSGGMGPRLFVSSRSYDQSAHPLDLSCCKFFLVAATVCDHTPKILL